MLHILFPLLLMWFVRRLLENLPSHFAVGIKGEEVATRYLRSLGYKIIERNTRVGRHKEIDIIAWDPVDSTLVFVEVKSRSMESEYAPSLNMTYNKKKALRDAVRRWIAQKEWEGGYRLDLLCIVDGYVTQHIKEVEIP